MAKKATRKSVRPSTGKSGPSTEDNQPSAQRLEIFSDAVMAIAMTIMVLELKVPEFDVADGLRSVLLPLAAKFASYVVSFIVIGVIWINHHQLIPTSPVATRPLMWWNLLLLFWVALIPFATHFVGENPYLPIAVASYGFVLFAAMGSFMLLRWHIADVTKTEQAMDAHHARAIRKLVVGTGLYALAVPLAFVSVYLSMAIFVIVPAMFFFPEALPEAIPEELEEEQ